MALRRVMWELRWNQASRGGLLTGWLMRVVVVGQKGRVCDEGGNLDDMMERGAGGDGAVSNGELEREFGRFLRYGLALGDGDVALDTQERRRSRAQLACMAAREVFFMKQHWAEQNVAAFKVATELSYCMHDSKYLMMGLCFGRAAKSQTG
ncbi:hypothetical protein Vafri_6707 [Volvox africanus]|uniref:Uncharacterized protein n=1 Tax=Volvox africanus TaxID=51714 RepID=A0A8J4AZL0_9CHLO|nr:hypothetical protein Vafri_6707 [Volvox africanus]